MSITSRKRIALCGLKSPIYRKLHQAVADAQSWSRIQSGNTLQYRGSAAFERGLRELLEKMVRQGIIRTYSLGIEQDINPSKHTLRIRVNYGLHWPRSEHFVFSNLFL